MTRGRADTKACERRQKAEAREAAMEARQSGTSAMATVSRRPRSLDAQACRSSMTEAADPQFSHCGNSACPGLATPRGATGPISPP